MQKIAELRIFDSDIFTIRMLFYKIQPGKEAALEFPSAKTASLHLPRIANQCKCRPKFGMGQRLIPQLCQFWR
jgi:hypothetical protein